MVEMDLTATIPQLYVSVLDVIMITVLCLLISLIAYMERFLTAGGSVAAFFTVFAIGIFGGFTWLFLLFMFTLTSFLATKYKFALKEALGAQEGIKGERSAKNVLANGSVPAVIAFLGFLDLPQFPRSLAGIVFISAVAVAASDTMASEIGILSKRTYLITNFKKVNPGTNGGISVLGEFSALIAAVFTSLVGYLVLFYSGTVPVDSSTVIIPV
ncbi:MAG: DUF92 domain-containing protein, partial [Thermoplasmata archaeon]|nr:DUF92 domain-containing protein [Thermoplasmata archaeon]